MPLTLGMDTWRTSAEAIAWINWEVSNASRWTLVGNTGQRLRRPVHYRVEHVIDTKVAQGCTEEHRGQLTVEEFLLVEFMASALNQFQLIDEAVVLVTQVGAGFVRVELLDDLGFGALMKVPSQPPR